MLNEPSDTEVETQARRQCHGQRVDGSPCSAPALTGEERCWFHTETPATVARRDLSRRQGGRRPCWQERPLEACNLSTLEGIRGELESVLANLKQSDFGPATANSMVAVLRQAESLIVSGELEAEIDALLQGRE